MHVVGSAVPCEERGWWLIRRGTLPRDRNVAPFHALFVLNRADVENLSEPVVNGMEFQISKPFLVRHCVRPCAGERANERRLSLATNLELTRGCGCVRVCARGSRCYRHRHTASLVCGSTTRPNWTPCTPSSPSALAPPPQLPLQVHTRTHI